LAESFSWRDGERLIRFGEGALAEAPGLLAAQGLEGYALLTTERAQGDARALAEGAKVVAHVPSGPVPDASAAVREQVRGMRPLVALGGGRVIDSAKAIAGADGGAVAAIPTTLSGAPMTRFHRMPAGVDQFNLVRPALVVAEPALMASQPMPDLAASAMNALAHAVESLYGPGRSPVTSMAALRAAELFESGLGDDPPRDDLALASILAGYAVGCAGFAVHHAVCQTTVRVLGTPHAQTNAVMLPHTAAFVAERAPDALQGVDPGTLRRLAALAGVTRLGELGVSEDQLDGVVEATLGHPAIGNTPGGTPTADELRALLVRAL
jgi:alcohol dehydrogenase class IV